MSQFPLSDQPSFEDQDGQKPAPETKILAETLLEGSDSPTTIPPENTLVVTISRQFGSNGAEVGKLVAQSSGLLYIDHEIIEGVANRLGVNSLLVEQQDEHTTGSLGHVMEAVASSSPFNVNYSSLRSLFNPAAKDKSSQRSQEMAYLRLTQRFIVETAAQGNAVIIGRGAQFLLQGFPRTLHIYIFAPMDVRIKNVMSSFRLGRKEAEQLIEQRDDAHDSYLRHHYGSDGRQPELYHLLINTGLFSCELAADLISQALPVAREIRA